MRELTRNQLKLYQSLNHKKFRHEYGLFIADGLHLVEAALKSNWLIERVVVRTDSLDLLKKLDVPSGIIADLPSALFDKLSPSESPQGIIAIMKARPLSIAGNNYIKNARRVIALDKIADPGNMGTIIRTAAAFRYDLVVCIGEGAEIYNPKTVRATQGAIFSIPIIEIESVKSFIQTFANSFELVVFTARAKKPLSKAPRVKRPVLIFGSEAAGISPEIEKVADFNFRIEQSEAVESLNVAVAAGVAMYRFYKGT